MTAKTGQILGGQYTLLSLAAEADGEALWLAEASWGKVLITLFVTEETAQGRRIQQHLFTASPLAPCASTSSLARRDRPPRNRQYRRPSV